jgi:replication factor A1
MADDGGPTVPVETRLKDLRVSELPVMITARIVTVMRKEVVRRSDGGRRPVLSGLLSDGTATVRFTWWDPPREEIDRGTVIRAAPVSVGEFQGRVELTFGWKTRVQPASEAELPLLRPEELPRRLVRELAVHEEGFILEARVAEVEPKTVTVGTERRQIHQGLLADGTGVVAFTAWTDFRLRAGEAVRLTGVYVRSFRGRAQLVLDERTHVERVSGEGLPLPGAGFGTETTLMGVLAEGSGSERATVVGRALALQPPSGLVMRCPSCQRILKEGACRIHGSVTGNPDLRLRLALDDGTGVVTVNLDRADVERLTGHTLEMCLATLRDRPDPSIIEAELFQTLFGRRFRARGAVRRDDFGLSMNPTEVLAEPLDLARAEELLRARLPGSGR